MVTGLLDLSFDPVLSLGGFAIRWDAVALVAALAIAIGVWVVRLHAALGSALRFEDVCFVLLGAIPGAVVVGRLVHVLDFADAYRLQPIGVFDLAHGSASLVGAVIGGALSAAYICRLLGGRVGVWADAAAVPLLLAIGLGKLAVMLGGAGQGAFTDGPFAVAFTGDQAWRGAAPARAAWPSQALEALWAFAGIALMRIVEAELGRRRRAGRGLALLAAVAWWLLGRSLVALTWRDVPVVAGWGPEGIASLVALAVMLLGIVLAWRRPEAPNERAAVGPASTGTRVP